MSPEEIERRFPDATKPWWVLSESNLVRCLAFLGAFCAVIAQSDAVPDLLRYGAAAIAAGCSAVLALTRAPNTTPTPRPPEGRG